MFAAIEKLIETLTKTQLGIMCKIAKNKRKTNNRSNIRYKILKTIINFNKIVRQIVKTKTIEKKT